MILTVEIFSFRAHVAASWLVFHDSKFLLQITNSQTDVQMTDLPRLPYLGTNRVEHTVSNSSSIVVVGNVAVGTCLFRGRYLVFYIG
jgi:hypothetical protein